MTFDIKQFLIENKIALNEAPRDIHFKGVKKSGPDFGEIRQKVAIVAHTLATTIDWTDRPAYADSDRDQYNRGKEAAVIHAMGKFQNEISTLERQWKRLMSKHGA